MNSQLNAMIYAVSCPGSAPVPLLAAMLVLLIVGGLVLGWLVCTLLLPVIESKISPSGREAPLAPVIDISVRRQMRERACLPDAVAK